MPLFEGWNRVPDWREDAEANGMRAVLETMFLLLTPDRWEAVAHFDGDEWDQTFADAPLPSFNTLTRLEAGQTYWIFVPADAELAAPADIQEAPEPSASLDVEVLDVCDEASHGLVVHWSVNGLGNSPDVSLTVLEPTGQFQQVAHDDGEGDATFAIHAAAGGTTTVLLYASRGNSEAATSAVRELLPCPGIPEPPPLGLGFHEPGGPDDLSAPPGEIRRSARRPPSR
jgi:hypothetical protein